MLNKELVDRIREIYQPAMEALKAHVDKEQQKYEALSARDHDAIGKLLKLHLIMEHYLRIYLIQHIRISEAKADRLTFAQKVDALPNQGFIGFAKQGMTNFNKIRNKLAHNLLFSLDSIAIEDIDGCLQWVADMPSNTTKMERLEKFSFFVFACLAVMPSEIAEKIQLAYVKAMELIPKNSLNSDARQPLGAG